MFCLIVIFVLAKTWGARAQIFKFCSDYFISFSESAPSRHPVFLASVMDTAQTFQSPLPLFHHTTCWGSVMFTVSRGHTERSLRRRGRPSRSYLTFADHHSLDDSILLP